MGGNSRQKKSFTPFSVFSFFKSKGPRKGEDTWEEAVGTRRIWPSDEDKGFRVADPNIDKKASVFIAKFHESRVSESERAVFPYGNA